MKCDGMQFRRASHLTWRDAEEGDQYTNGEQIPEGYIVVTGIRSGTQRPIESHGLTNLAYGATTAYLVYDGRVYSTHLPKRRLTE